MSLNYIPPSDSSDSDISFEKDYMQPQSKVTEISEFDSPTPRTSTFHNMENVSMDFLNDSGNTF